MQQKNEIQFFLIISNKNIFFDCDLKYNLLLENMLTDWLNECDSKSLTLIDFELFFFLLWLRI